MYPQDTPTMSEHDLQQHIITKLTELAVGQAEIATDMKAVKEHLKTLNGKVAAHEKQLNERLNSCPPVAAAEGRIRPLEDFVTEQKAVEKTSKVWTDHLWPIGRYAIGTILAALFILVLTHADVFSRLIKAG
jgi:hypothetical protein